MRPVSWAPSPLRARGTHAAPDNRKGDLQAMSSPDDDQPLDLDDLDPAGFEDVDELDPHDRELGLFDEGDAELPADAA